MDQLGDEGASPLSRARLAAAHLLRTQSKLEESAKLQELQV
jgi:hypothetical protein